MGAEVHLTILLTRRQEAPGLEEDHRRHRAHSGQAVDVQY